jgi:putative ABC transport system permease protein
MLSDLKLAVRRLRQTPGFVFGAVLTLALAVGANTAIFAVADAVLFRPLPYRDPGRLFVVRSVDRVTGFRSSGVPYDYVEALQHHHSGVAGVALRSTTIMTRQPGPDGAEHIETCFAAPDYFQVLGVQPIRGRLFDRSDLPDGSRRAILSYDAWQRRFGGDESIVGRSAGLGVDQRIVIGVLPAGFIFPTASLRHQMRMTGRAEFVTAAAPPTTLKRQSSVTLGGMASDAIVRLRPGVTREQAQAEFDALIAPIRAARRETRDIVLDDLRSLLFPSGRGALALLLGAAGLVLLIGCANLASMLLTRTRRRERELAVHAAVGATPLRLLRPIVFEAALLAFAAAAVGLAAARVTFGWILREVPPMAYGRASIAIDTRVAVFSLLLGLAAGLLFAAAPAWRASRHDALLLLRRQSAPRQVRRGRGTIAAQIAMAVLLVIGAVTAAQNLVAVLDEPVGFDAANVIAVDTSPPRGEAPRRFYERAAAAVSRLPDVTSAGAGYPTPYYNLLANETVTSGPPAVREVHVLAGYLESLRMRLREGRLPRVEDSNVAVLSATAASALFSGRSAVGETLRRDAGPLQIIGVVDDEIPAAGRIGLVVYVVPDDPRGHLTLVVRARARSAATLASIRREIVQLVPMEEPVTAAWMMDSIGSLGTYRHPRFQTVVLGSFSVLALGLAALGIFASVAANVAARTREFGIKLAIGAPTEALVREIVRTMLMTAATGLTAGLAATYLAARVTSASLAGFAAPTIISAAIACTTVVAVAFVAAVLPARRVRDLDPVVALRAE